MWLFCHTSGAQRAGGAEAVSAWDVSLGRSSALLAMVWTLILTLAGGAAAQPRSPYSLAQGLSAGYSVDIDESGCTTPSGTCAGGSGGSLQASGQGNVNYGYNQECASSQDGGPFSIGHYPPLNCAQVSRGYASAGSPEQPSGFWFTGNQNCVNAGRAFSGSTFTWNVQLPQSGYWHVDGYIPEWTSYGFGNQYNLTADDGQSQTNFTQQTYHGHWVSLFASHPFTAAQTYMVQLSLVDGADSNCHYQIADQVRWVFDKPFVPTNTSRPLITGSATVGQTLTATTGTWTNYPTSYSYEWQACSSAGTACAPIAGATHHTYRLTSHDLGRRILVQETASNAGGPSSPALSAPTKTVTAAVPRNLARPTISGKPQFGQTLTEIHGRWTNAPTSFNYRWQRCDTLGTNCVPIAGARSRSYRVTSASIGHTIDVVETARNTAGSGAPSTSFETLIVDARKGRNIPACPTRKSAATGDRAVAKLPPSRGASLRPRGSAITLPSAIRRTTGHARRFTLSIPLTPGTQKFLNDKCSKPLEGSGYVNFAQQAARWHITLPQRSQGILQVIAIRGLTWVQAPGLLRGKRRHNWLLLNTRRDYVTFNHIPLLRDLAVLTNPLRSVELLKSLRAHGAATRASDTSSGDPTISSECNNGAPVVHDQTPDAQALTWDHTIGLKATEAALSSWTKDEVSVAAKESGLCEVSLSVTNIHQEGFDVQIEFKNPVPQRQIGSPKTSVTTTWTETIHYEFPKCADGTWKGTSHTKLTYPPSAPVSFSNQYGGGAMTLEISGDTAFLQSDESFDGTLTAPWPQFVLSPDGSLEVIDPETVFLSSFTRHIDATGEAVISGDEFSATVAGGSVFTEAAPPTTPNEGVFPRSYTLTGTFSCPDSLSVDSSVLDHIDFHKTLPSLLTPIPKSVSWEEQIQVQSSAS